MTAIIPSTQDTQLDLRATNATEFRELLGRIRDAAGLTGGQIANKTQMPRSTAYSLTNTNRPGLPSNEDQVLAYVRACGLTATQVDVVRDLWRKLHNEQENAKNTKNAAAMAASMLKENHSGFQIVRSWPATESDDMSDMLIGLGSMPGPTSAADRARLRRQQLARRRDHVQQRTTTLLDVMHYVLAEEDRYQRALTLVKLLSALAFVFVAGVVAIAVLIPSTATYLGTGLVAVLIVAARALNGKRLRIRFPKDASPQ